MSIIYEAQSNVHVPTLKCSYPIGTRFIADGDKLFVGEQETIIGNDFNILVRHGFIKRLNEEESLTPEKVVEPKTIKSAERPKMKVEIQEDFTTSIESKSQENKKIVKEVNNNDNEKTVRGMKVISPEATPIQKIETKSTKNITPEKAAQIEATKKARIEALAKARAVAQEKAAKAREAKEKENTTQEKK